MPDGLFSNLGNKKDDDSQNKSKITVEPSQEESRADQNRRRLGVTDPFTRKWWDKEWTGFKGTQRT